MNFRFLLLSPLLIAGSLAGPACAAGGPPFRDAPAGEALPQSLVYRFKPTLPFYGPGQLGEVVFENTNQRTPRTLFYLRILGRQTDGSLRLRQYEGEVHRSGARAELRSKRCYVFGKNQFEDRLVPLERWDCEHLHFVYESPSAFARRDVLVPINTERTVYADWFAPAPLEPLVVAGEYADQPYFAGQLAPLRPRETPGENADAVVWGYEAARKLRNGNILEVAREDGRVVGRLRVISRPGDFILCKWIEGDRGAGVIAFTQRSQIPAGGLF